MSGSSSTAALTDSASGPRAPTMLDAVLPVVVPIGLLALTIALFGIDATNGPLQVALFLSAAFAGLLAFKNGFTVAAVADAAVGGVVNVSGIGPNVIAGDQYVADVLSSRMFRGEFARRGLAPQVLSRAVEDSGTVTSVLVPWNTCGAYRSGVLGVSTAAYFPFCFFNLLSPLLDVLYGFIGFKVPQLEPGDAAAGPPREGDPAGRGA